MKKELFKFLFLFMVAVGGGPVAAAVYQWTVIPDTNGNSDPNINWQPGMSPSSVSPSARAMMAEIQKWRKDTTGSALQAFGGPTAYTITSNEGFASTAVMAGTVLGFYIPSINAANPTLNVDGLGALPLVTAIGSPVPAGALNANAHYTASFSNVASVWVLQNYYASSFNVPLGGLLYSTISTPPNANFVEAGGQCISTTTYAVYWAAIGSPASGACPGGQFAVLDARGRSLVALDNLGSLGAAGRLTSSGTGCGTAMTSLGASCANGSQSQTLTLAQTPTGITSSGAALSVTTTTGPSLLSNGNLAQNLASGTNGFGWSNSPTVGTVGASGATAAQSVASNNTGGGAHPLVNPNVAVYIYIRVL